MRVGPSVWRCASSVTFELLGRVPPGRSPRYFQQQSAARKVMDGTSLAVLPAAPSRGSRHATQQALLELEPHPTADALCITADAVDEDIVLDGVHAKQLSGVAVSAERGKLSEHHPAARGVGSDVIDLVTDAFKQERKRLIAQRRRVLYDLTHPNPSDYTYKDKLVPPPPLSFGKITDEAKQLGNKVMLGQHYTLVRRAGMMRDETDTASTTVGGQQRRTRRKPTLYDNHNFFFELNDLYQEIVLVGKACAGKSSMLNALLGQPVAKTSSQPNTTRQISFYQSVSPEEMQRYLNVKGNGLVKLPGGGVQLTFVDVPGFGIEGMSDQWRDKAIALTDAYLGVRRSVNTVLFCIDCERGLTKVDLRYFSWLENLHGVFFIVLTKCDSVPHSRVCSVMRQIYATITKNRRKYRKVFPFIIPTSARDGTNIEFLRGLIAETSGLIPGDRLRQLLKTKADADMEAALKEEARRVQEAHRVGTQEAKAFFTALKEEKYYNALGSSVGNAPSPPPPMKPQKYVLPLNGSDATAMDAHVRTPADEPLLAFPSDDWNRQNNNDIVPNLNHPFGMNENEKVRRRQRFLAWRHTHPLQRHTSDYGTFRLNTGLERPDAEWLELPYMETGVSGNDAKSDCVVAAQKNLTYLTEGGNNNMGSTGSVTPVGDREMKDETVMTTTSTGTASPSAVIGLCEGSKSPTVHQQTSGGVSQFLGLLDDYAKQAAPVGWDKRRCAKETRWRERLHMRSVTRFLVEEKDGRIAEYKAGKKFGPSLVEPCEVEKRRSQWAARQFVQQAVAVRPTSPWTALDVLRKERERVKQEAAMRGMTKKELQAYLRNSGSVTEGFESFEGEVTAAKYMNEIRQAETLRSQKQMHLNSTAKISYRSMPVGLWKRYGERATYWPTSRVKGR
ncbi:hypothetical protein TraAM80_05618 [Trypanosoma rangeli]|uniref:EngB-type G domain-containing protein n=1 Tax=Trypanosoma rangeli TaxID=5698 RepID=A0A3R7NJM0_TRYRA|nr:uncharacterized protein TraAM80_05618 [Trypanosoma rangeli]RNF03560.1 hypothetical protein TraAM80_05618 [Trypanosoma rangeli]|eukprot:RNF03560.1 hypothetical protein TraAM80_05618 [Trypanosoma rangeli]